MEGSQFSNMTKIPGSVADLGPNSGVCLQSPRSQTQDSAAVILAFYPVILTAPPPPALPLTHRQKLLGSLILLWCHPMQGPSLSSNTYLPFADFPFSSSHCAHWKFFSIVKTKQNKILQAFSETRFSPKNISLLVFLLGKRRRSPGSIPRNH